MGRNPRRRGGDERGRALDRADRDVRKRRIAPCGSRRRFGPEALAPVCGCCNDGGRSMRWRRLVPALVLAGACGLLAAPAGAATAAQGGAARLPRGYTLVSSDTLVASAGEQTRGVVTCPPGRVPLSGSASIHSLSLLATV